MAHDPVCIWWLKIKIQRHSALRNKPILGGPTELWRLGLWELPTYVILQNTYVAFPRNGEVPWYHGSGNQPLAPPTDFWRQTDLGDLLWMEEILRHQTKPGMMIPLHIPNFPWSQSGANWILSIHMDQGPEETWLIQAAAPAWRSEPSAPSRSPPSAGCSR